MIKRVSVYATGIAIKDGPVNHFRPGEGYSYMKANTANKEYVFAKVRQFLIRPVIGLDKQTTTMGFVLLDLEF